MQSVTQNINSEKKSQRNKKPVSSPALIATSTGTPPNPLRKQANPSDNTDKNKGTPGRPPTVDSWAKYRANSPSLNTISDYLTKKRSFEEIEDLDHQQLPKEPSNPIKRQAISNSPETNNSRKEEEPTTEEMEKILEEIRNSSDKTVTAINQLRAQMEEINTKWEKKFNSLSAEVETLKLKAAASNDETVNKIANEAKVKLNTMLTTGDGPSSLLEMKQKLNYLDNVAEKNERLLRKNNIIIKGLTIQKDNLLKQINNFIETHFKLSNIVQEAYIIGQQRDVVKVKLNSSESKAIILRNKFTALKNSNIYVEADLTPKEAQIAKKLRDIAKHKKSNGANVKVYSSKLLINNQWWIWNDEMADIILSPANSITNTLQSPSGVPMTQKSKNYTKNSM